VYPSDTICAVNNTQTYEGANNTTCLSIRTFHLLLFFPGVDVATPTWQCVIILKESIEILTNHLNSHHSPCSAAYLNYSGGFLWGPQPWKHFVNLLDSLFFNVRKSLRDLSGCFTRKCWMYTCQSKYLFTHDVQYFNTRLMRNSKIFRKIQNNLKVKKKATYFFFPCVLKA
jgi:hypothetical protein